MDDLKRVAILGSTGSIGRQSLEVIRSMPDAVQVVALAGGRNLKLLEQQIHEFRPRLFSSAVSIDRHEGSEFVSMEEIAGHPDVDLVIVATSGKAGLGPTLTALRAGKTVAIASKEVLVTAGEIIFREADHHQARIFPIDSEHSAIFQCLQGEQNEPRRIILTASGGPFYRYSDAQLVQITPEQALRHPVWKMGTKVTIDSATLMNKGLEVIEAHWLFSLPFASIQILIHPQSIVHSMVEFADGSLKAQLGPPDMRLPIQYALSYPERWFNPSFPRLHWTEACDLRFEPVDSSRFPCLNSAIEAGKAGGTYPAVLCAADEVAVDLFLNHRIGFPDIAGIVQEVLQHHNGISHPSIEQILDADEWAREYALSSSLVRSEERGRPLDSLRGN